MPFGAWLKSKAKEMREERQFKSGVNAEAKRARTEAYRQAYRKRMLRQAQAQGQQRAKPRGKGGLLDLLVGSTGQTKQKMPTFKLPDVSDMGLFGGSERKKSRGKRRR